PGLFSPFELYDQMIVLVFLLGDETAPGLARDADHAVLDGEDAIRVLVLAMTLEPGVEALKVLAIEQVDDLFGRVGGHGPLSCRKRRQEGQQQRDLDAVASHGNSPFRS